jgi:large subunit ribosomal protein L22
MNKEKETVTATGKFIILSPRKVRSVARIIKDKDVNEAKALLLFTPRRAAPEVLKVLKNAISNAKQDGSYNMDNLYVKAVEIDKGPIIKRWNPRARGMANRVNRFMSHIKITLSER